MEVINPNIYLLPQVRVLTYPALYCPKRVAKNLVQLGLYSYEIIGNVKDKHGILALTDHTEQNFGGTLITANPMLMAGERKLILVSGDIVFTREPLCSTAAFERKAHEG